MTEFEIAFLERLDRLAEAFEELARRSDSLVERGQDIAKAVDQLRMEIARKW